MFVYLCKFIDIKIKKKYKNYYFLQIKDLGERWASLRANYEGELEKLEDIKKAKLDEICLPDRFFTRAHSFPGSMLLPFTITCAHSSFHN